MDLEPVDIVIDTEKLADKPAAAIDLGANEPLKVEAAPEKRNTEDDGIELLKQQLEDRRREAEEARRQKAQVEQIAVQQQAQLRNFQFQASDSQHTSFVNAIAAYERDAEMLERELAATLEANDYAKAAKLQRQMGQIDNRLMTLQQGREALEDKIRTQQAEAQQPQRQMQPPVHQQNLDPVESQIATLSEASKHWIRQRPEVITNPQMKALMTAGHFEAVAKNIPVESPEYFSYIEGKLTNDGQPQQRTAAPTRQSMASAPVSRSAAPVTQNGRSMTINLTPEMREIARANDMSDEEYAMYRLKEIQSGNIRA